MFTRSSSGKRLEPYVISFIAICFALVLMGPSTKLPVSVIVGLTYNCDWAFEIPEAADDGNAHCHVPDASTLVRAYCSTEAGTSNVNFYERTEGAPNTGTTGMLTSDLLCDIDGEFSTTFTDAAVAANSNLALGLITPFSTGWVRVTLEYTRD